MTRHFWLTLPLFTACAIDTVEPETLDEDTQQIHGEFTEPASPFSLGRAVKIPGCTATKISARFALTASHCGSSVGDRVRFYSSGPGFDTTTAADVVAVHIRPGVNPVACRDDFECDDVNGDFADVAVLELAQPTDGAGAETDLEGHQATLAWLYPGYGYDGVKVGAGAHNGVSNPTGILLQYPDETTSDDDDDGHFDSRDYTTDKGDSGGPFYYQSRILGTLWGKYSTGVNSWNYYTSVPHHLNWILQTIGFHWRGLPPQASTLYTGTVIQSFVGSELRCQYACEKTSSCEAYNYMPAQSMCNLENDVAGATTASSWRGALKYGARAGSAGDAVGFVRSDNVNSVVHVATNGTIHELVLNGTSWSVVGINPSATIASKLTAYRRTEDVDAIVFRSLTGHIIQMLRTGTTWTDEADLTALTGGEIATGTPMAYVRADGVNAVVYRGATTNHIIELRRGSRGFIATDLMAAIGSSVTAASDPTANARSDGNSSVVFRSTSGYVYELYRATAGDWHIGAPSALASAPTPLDRPFAYTKRDGTNAIVYRDDTGQLVDLTLSGTQWSFQHVGSNAVGQPVGYVRTDAANAIMFRNTSNQLVQVTAATTNLTSLTGAPATATSPTVYVRSDGNNSVLFETSANHVGELYVKRGGTWADGDITAVALESP